MDTTDVLLNSQLIRVENGYLIFPNYSTYDQIRTQNSKFGRMERVEWESRFKDFKSLRTIYEEIIDKDIDHKEKIANYSKPLLDELKLKHGDDYIFAPVVIENKDLFDFGNEGNYFLKIEGHEPDIENFVNRDGFVQIGDSILQYKDNYIKIVLNGDKSKITNLDFYTESHKEDSVIVIEIIKENIKFTDTNLRVAFNGNELCYGYTGGGGQRVIGYATAGFSSYIDYYNYYGYGLAVRLYRPFAYLKAVNESKGLFGWSKKKTQFLRIVGSNILYTNDGIPQIYRFISSLDVGTNGSLETELTYWVYWTDIWYPQMPIYGSWQGNATFHGRDGSNCSL